MTLQKRISKWLVHIKKYIVLYKDGYYIIPYLSNSPDVMINSLKGMPFTKHNPNENVIHTNNVFSKGALYYRELADGLWVIITEIQFLKDVCTKALYDGEPSEYYFLSHISFKVQVDTNNINSIKVPTVGWTLYKPGHEATAYYSKGTDGIFTNIIFTREWAEKNIPFEHFEETNILRKYFESNETLMVWEDLVPNASIVVDNLLTILKSKEVAITNHLQLKISCLELVTDFLKIASKKHIHETENTIKEADRRHLAKAEKILMDSLTTTFPTIDAIAQQVHLSPTKLKNSFKLVYGKPLFQYYQDKQMQLALEMLKSKQYSVKDVSNALGYENQSNFTTAFKKAYNVLPSEIV